MKNNECVIYVITKHGKKQTFHKDKDVWVQISSTGRVFRMSAEQVLSHILPPLAAGKKSPARVSVKRRAAPKKP